MEDEKVKPPKEKAEEVKIAETQTKKLIKEQLSQEETLRAEESGSEGNHVRNLISSIRMPEKREVLLHLKRYNVLIITRARFDKDFFTS